MTPRWIIIEGWSASGKTTLATRLARRLDKPYLSIGRPQGQLARSVNGELTRLVEGYASTGAVLDQSWWSNEVYAPLKRNRQELWPEVRRWLELATADGVLIHCDTDHVEQLEQLTPANGDELSASTGRKLFHEALGKSRLPQARRLVYDLNGDGRVRCSDADSVLGRLQRQNLRSFDPRVRWGLGNPYTAQVALVSDRNPRGGLPFADSVSGRYLLRAMGYLSWTTDNVYVANADSSTLQVELEPLVQHRGRIVALGRIAEQKLIELGLTPYYVEHPQWWRRFKSGLEKTYARRLAKASGLHYSRD